MLAQEDDVWTVSLTARDGERPPLELGEFRAWPAASRARRWPR